MFDLIEKTPISELIPLGKGLFRGEAQDGNRTLCFVIKMTSKGQVIVKQAVFRVFNQTLVSGGK